MKRELLSKVISWIESPIDGDEKTTLKWVEVVFWENLGLQLGISCNANWVRKGKEAVFEITPESSYRPVYPILEMDFLDVEIALRDRLNCLQLPTELLDIFPFRGIVISGMNSGSEYWCNLSLKHVEQLRYDSELVKALNICLKNAPTQKLRHQAKKLHAIAGGNR